MTERGFVLYPLAEIAPEDLQVPGKGSLADLLKSISGDSIERLS
jgi:2-amino-4-hydroxy-6-hydroxymethyldihydropteridine diphosphokinase